jgi:hypothetical protein
MNFKVLRLSSSGSLLLVALIAGCLWFYNDWRNAWSPDLNKVFNVDGRMIGFEVRSLDFKEDGEQLTYSLEVYADAVGPGPSKTFVPVLSITQLARPMLFVPKNHRFILATKNLEPVTFFETARIVKLEGAWDLKLKPNPNSIYRYVLNLEFYLVSPGKAGELVINDDTAFSGKIEKIPSIYADEFNSPKNPN